jgi:hypothetical protein
MRSVTGASFETGLGQGKGSYRGPRLCSGVFLVAAFLKSSMKRSAPFIDGEGFGSGSRALGLALESFDKAEHPEEQDH